MDVGGLGVEDRVSSRLEMDSWIKRVWREDMVFL